MWKLKRNRKESSSLSQSVLQLVVLLSEKHDVMRFTISVRKNDLKTSAKTTKKLTKIPIKTIV